MLIYGGSGREADSPQLRPHFRLRRICLNTGNLQVISGSERDDRSVRYIPINSLLLGSFVTFLH